MSQQPPPVPGNKPFFNNAYRQFVMSVGVDESHQFDEDDTNTATTSDSFDTSTINNITSPTTMNDNLDTMNELTVMVDDEEEDDDMDLFEDDDDQTYSHRRLTMDSSMASDESFTDAGSSMDDSDLQMLENNLKHGKFGITEHSHKINRRRNVTTNTEKGQDSDTVDQVEPSPIPPVNTLDIAQPKPSSTKFKTSDEARRFLSEHLPILVRRYKFLNFVKKDPSLKKARKRQELIKETIETERTYVQNLKTFLNLYYYPLTENRDQGKGVLKKQSDIQVLFSNIDQIQKINQTLLTDLEQANPEVHFKNVGTGTEGTENQQQTNSQPSTPQPSTPQPSTPRGTTTSVTSPSTSQSPRATGSAPVMVIKRRDDPARNQKGVATSYRIYERIGKPFELLVPFLKAYTTYINNHDRATELFESLKKKKRFKEFLSERTPRLKMLLSEILTNTPPEHIEYASLEKVVNEIQKIASYINEQKRNFDNVRFVYEAYGMIDKIYPGFIQPNRKFVRKSSLIVKYRQVKLQRSEESKKTISGETKKAPPLPPRSFGLPNTSVGGTDAKPPRQQGDIYGLLANVASGQKRQRLVYNEARFTIYQFTDVMVLIEEKSNEEEGQATRSALQTLTRKATVFMNPKAATTSQSPSNNNNSGEEGGQTSVKYHQLKLTLGKTLHFIFYYFVDVDSFFGLGQQSANSKSPKLPNKGFHAFDIDDNDIPIRVISKGIQFEYVIKTSTTDEKNEWLESITTGINECTNVKNYVNRGVVLQQPSDIFKIGKERTIMHGQAIEKLKSHQEMEQQQMLLQVRMGQVTQDIQSKKELLARLQQEIKELEEEKKVKEAKLEVIKEEKVQVRDKLTTLWQDIQQKDQISLKVLHEEKDAFRQIFGCDFGAQLSLSSGSNTQELSEAAMQLLSKSKTQSSSGQGSSHGSSTPSEKKPNSILKNLLGGSDSSPSQRKVTIKHTQFIENQVKGQSK